MYWRLSLSIRLPTAKLFLIIAVLSSADYFERGDNPALFSVVLKIKLLETTLDELGSSGGWAVDCVGAQR